MKFEIVIEGRTQPELIAALDAARDRLIDGGCFLNVCGCTTVEMRPATDADEDEFRALYKAAHPTPAPWVGKK